MVHFRGGVATRQDGTSAAEPRGGQYQDGTSAAEPRGFVVEQILVRNLGEEEPMLAHVRDRMQRASMLVTFNGKSFDLPLLRTRFAMARLAPPMEPPHLDLVHVARRLHKPRGVECRLTSIEREVLGFERVDDVPGSEVSACYLHFLRTGDAAGLLRVVEHNAWDVVAMAAMVGLYGEPLEGSQLDAVDLVGVARTLKRARAVDEAWEVAERAVAAGGGEASLRARAEIAKARGDRARALADFETVAEGVDDPRVRLELAKLYEHYARDHEKALAAVRAGTGEGEAARAQREARLVAETGAGDRRAGVHSGGGCASAEVAAVGDGPLSRLPAPPPHHLRNQHPRGAPAARCSDSTAPDPGNRHQRLALRAHAIAEPRFTLVAEDKDRSDSGERKAQRSSGRQLPSAPMTCSFFTRSRASVSARSVVRASLTSSAPPSATRTAVGASPGCGAGVPRSGTRVHAEEGGGTEDRADVVRVADAIERDRGPAALRQRVPQLLRARPAPLAREEAEPSRGRLRPLPIRARSPSVSSPHTACLRAEARPPHQSGSLTSCRYAARVRDAKNGSSGRRAKTASAPRLAPRTVSP